MIRRTNVRKALYIKSLSITLANGTKCSYTNPNYLTSLGYKCHSKNNIIHTRNCFTEKKKHTAVTLSLFLFGSKPNFSSVRRLDVLLEESSSFPLQLPNTVA